MAKKTPAPPLPAELPLLPMAKKTPAPPLPAELPRIGLSEAILRVGEERSELDKIFALLLDPNNLGHNTELNDNEILAFSVLGTLAQKYPSLDLKIFLFENLKYRVSKNRAGRKEIVKMAQRALEPNNEMNQGRFGRWFGRRPPPPPR